MYSTKWKCVCCNTICFHLRRGRCYVEPCWLMFYHSFCCFRILVFYSLSILSVTSFKLLYYCVLNVTNIMIWFHCSWHVEVEGNCGEDVCQVKLVCHLGVVRPQRFCSPFRHSLVCHASCEEVLWILTQACKKVQKGVHRTFVWDMMTMKKRQSVAPLWKILW